MKYEWTWYQRVCPIYRKRKGKTTIKIQIHDAKSLRAETILAKVRLIFLSAAYWSNLMQYRFNCRMSSCSGKWCFISHIYHMNHNSISSEMLTWYHTHNKTSGKPNPGLNMHMQDFLHGEWKNQRLSFRNEISEYIIEWMWICNNAMRSSMRCL